MFKHVIVKYVFRFTIISYVYNENYYFSKNVSINIITFLVLLLFTSKQVFRCRAFLLVINCVIWTSSLSSLADQRSCETWIHKVITFFFCQNSPRSAISSTNTIDICVVQDQLFLSSFFQWYWFVKLL